MQIYVSATMWKTSFQDHMLSTFDRNGVYALSPEYRRVGGRAGGWVCVWGGGGGGGGTPSLIY
jgi:hypothetical protein